MPLLSRKMSDQEKSVKLCRRYMTERPEEWDTVMREIGYVKIRPLAEDWEERFKKLQHLICNCGEDNCPRCERIKEFIRTLQPKATGEWPLKKEHTNDCLIYQPTSNQYECMCGADTWNAALEACAKARCLSVEELKTIINEYACYDDGCVNKIVQAIKQRMEGGK